MIIYGSNSSHLLTEPLSGTACEACGTPNSLWLSVFGRYAHLYWVPLLPAGKLGGAECRHCHQLLRHNQLPPHLKAEFMALKRRAKTPVWHFAGLLLAMLIVVGSVLASKVNRKEDQTYLTRPRVGDLYHVRMEGNNYSLLKVVAVDGNSVQLQANSYQTSSSTQVAELNKPENYHQEPFDLTRYDLQIMMRKEQIVDVERP